MDNRNKIGGLGVLDVLLIIFIVLKCVGVISWSWPVVLIPLWIQLGFIAFFIIIFIVIEGVTKREIEKDDYF